MKDTTAAAILVFAISAVTSLPDTIWRFSLETGKQPEQQQLQQNGNPECGLASDTGNFVECINLGPTDMSLLEGALTAADSSYSDLYELHIENSNVSQLGPIFQAHNIGTLDLINDGVTPLPFDPLSYLNMGCTTLRMNNNKILSIDAFNGPNTLTEVNLAENQIETISSKAFIDNTKLETLALYSNNLTSIKAKTFMGLTKLQTLSLDENRIDSIAVGSFSGLTAIKMVNLSHNYLSTLDDGTFDGLETAELYLDNNPFVCYCNMQWLKDWLETNEITSGATCAFPLNTNFTDTDPFTCP